MERTAFSLFFTIVTLSFIPSAENAIIKRSTNSGKNDLLIFSVSNSGTIENRMYMNGEHIPGSKLDITGTPEDAQYKEGRVFSALTNARRIFEQHNLLLNCRVILQEFFTRHAFLSSDSSRALEELQEIFSEQELKTKIDDMRAELRTSNMKVRDNEKEAK